MNISDQVYAAAGAFKEAIEKMGVKNVVVIYSFTEDDPRGDKVQTGFESAGYLQTLGALELLKNRLLNPES